MKHLLVFNLRMDEDDPVMGFAVEWVRALAARFERVTVVTMHRGRVTPIPDVRILSAGRELGLAEPLRVGRFYRTVLQVLREHPPDVAFSHMIPIFSALFAPLARHRGIPQLLWYAHGHVSWELRLAERLVDGCVTSMSHGFRLPSSKLQVLHQGIDADRFRPPVETREAYGRTVVMLGRISEVKRVVETVEVLAQARERGVPVRMEVFGGPSTREDERYEKLVHQRVEQLRLAEDVIFHGPVSHAAAPHAYQRGGLFMNLSRGSSLDKSTLEAMASGCIPIGTSGGFAAFARACGFERLAPPDDPASIRDALVELAGLEPAAAARLRQAVRQSVQRHHSLDALADSIVERLAALCIDAGGISGAAQGGPRTPTPTDPGLQPAARRPVPS